MRWMDAKWGLLPVVAATLVACGGGGDTAKDNVDTGTSVTLSGSAATGLALGNATVAVKCATGSGDATTNAAGAYSVTLSNAALPCVLKVTSADNTVTYHSVAAGSGGGAAVANITPLTELVVARATGMTPAQFFNNFSSAQTQVIAASSLDAAVAAVAQALNSAVSLGSVNPLTGELRPATTENPDGGNAHDQLLDQLQQAITNAGTTLAALSTIAASSGSGGGTLGNALQSDLAAAMADGSFGVYEEDEGVLVLSGVYATGAPVNGVYNLQELTYSLSGNQWQPLTRDTSGDRRYLTSSGWTTRGDLSAGGMTIQQTGPDTFLYRDAIAQNFVITSTSPATVNLADLDPTRTGTVTLPTGSRVLHFEASLNQEVYHLNGGEGFFGVGSLSQLRSTYASTGTGRAVLTWMGDGASTGMLGWQFGPGESSGPLYLFTAFDPLCLSGCAEPVAAANNGTWQITTRNGQQVLELDIPAGVGSTTLSAGQKYIYSVIPGGNVQEGKYSPAGTPWDSFSNYNRTAANAVLAALSLPSLPSN